MSSFVKTKLKAARDALGKRQYEAARDAAAQVLDYEPDNYNAWVRFLRWDTRLCGSSPISTDSFLFGLVHREDTSFWGWLHWN